MKTQKVKTKTKKQVKRAVEVAKLVNEKYRDIMKKLAYE